MANSLSPLPGTANNRAPNILKKNPSPKQTAKPLMRDVQPNVVASLNWDANPASSSADCDVSSPLKALLSLSIIVIDVMF